MLKRLFCLFFGDLEVSLHLFKPHFETPDAVREVGKEIIEPDDIA